MEQHPVPRNISSFQFHLIGDMTLRQFGYLIAGALCAFIVFKIVPLPVILKYPFAGIFAFAGVAFAFLPIQERPLDRWIVAFIKSIYSPTQFLWQKEGTFLEILAKQTTVSTKKLSQTHTQTHQDARTKLHQYLATLPQSPHQTLNSREKSYIDQTLALFNTTSYPQKPKVAVSTPLVTNTVEPEPPKVPQEVKSPPQPVKTESIQSVPVPIQSEIKPQPVPSINNQAGTDYMEIHKMLKELALQKESLAQELARLKSEIKKIEEPLIIKPEVSQEGNKQPTIKAFTAQSAVNEIGMPAIPQTPNIVSGVIRDAQKKLVPNIILTIKDNKGNPIRALKTNKLGQFATATPLPNGVYLIEVEDPLKRYAFDIAEITLSGKVFLPIAISAKGEKELLREKLTKELFGNKT